VNRSAQAVQIAIAGTIEIHSTTRSRRGELPLCSMFSPTLTVDFQLRRYISGVITRMISPELHSVKSESKPDLLDKLGPANLAVNNRREGFNSSFLALPEKAKGRAPMISVIKDALPSSSPQELLADKIDPALKACK
jgi:hypothetical protein